MTDYARPLWLGGGISYEALAIIEAALRERAESMDGTSSLRTEVMNVANAAHAEITKRPQPMCDLV